MIGFKNFLQNCKKIVLFISVIATVSTLFFIFSSGERYKLNPEAIVKENRDQINAFVNDKELNSTKDGRLLILAYRSLTCIVSGEACLVDPNKHEDNFNKSIFGLTSNLFAYPTSNPPASGIYWTYTGLQNTGFIPKSYAAQGIGFAAIQGYQGIWKLFRDLAYVVLVLVIVVIGFLIMFRVKINPQTVITLENALPRIIVTLLLITFSFAIAGFLIDLMYLVIALMISQLTQLNITHFAPSDAVGLINKYSTAKIGDIYNPTDGLWTIGTSFFSVLPYLVRSVFQTFFTLFGAILLNKYIVVEHLEKLVKWTEGIGGTIGGGVSALGFGGSATIGAALGGLISQFGTLIMSIAFISVIWPIVAPLLVGLIVFLSIVFLVFRVFFLVLKIYVSIILQIIFSPVILLINAVPGKNMFSKWIRSLFANIFVFPMIILLILIADILGSLNNSGNVWKPPFIYGIDTKAFSTLLALGMLLVIPDMIKAFKAALGVKESPIKFGLGMFFGGASGIGGAGMEQLSKFGYMGHGIDTVKKLLGIKPKKP